MTLIEYLDQHGISQSEFGAKFTPRVSQSLVSQWLRGTTRMTLDRAIECKRITGGQVTEEDCAALFRGVAPVPQQAA